MDGYRKKWGVAEWAALVLSAAGVLTIAACMLSRANSNSTATNWVALAIGGLYLVVGLIVAVQAYLARRRARRELTKRRAEAMARESSALAGLTGNWLDDAAQAAVAAGVKPKKDGEGEYLEVRLPPADWANDAGAKRMAKQGLEELRKWDSIKVRVPPTASPLFNIHAKTEADLLAPMPERWIGQDEARAMFGEGQSPDGADAMAYAFLGSYPPDRGDDYAGDIPEASIPSTDPCAGTGTPSDPDHLVWMENDAILRRLGINCLPGRRYEQVRNGQRGELTLEQVQRLVQAERSRASKTILISTPTGDSDFFRQAAIKANDERARASGLRGAAAVKADRSAIRQVWQRERVEHINQTSPAGRAELESILASGPGITMQQIDQVESYVLADRQKHRLLDYQSADQVRLIVKLDSEAASSAAAVVLLANNLRNTLEWAEGMQTRVIAGIANSVVGQRAGHATTEIRDEVDGIVFAFRALQGWLKTPELAYHDEIHQAAAGLGQRIASLRSILEPEGDDAGAVQEGCGKDASSKQGT